MTCDDCDATYVGETERGLKTQFSELRRKSSVGSEVSQHVHVDRPEHGVSLDKVKILTVDNRKFERGVKEDSVMEPSLNKDGGRFLLPAVYTNLLKARARGDVPVPGPHLKLRPVTWFHNGIVEPT